jgi:hypothetical protein
MVILHKDHGVYQIPDNLTKQTTLLNKFYYLKFEKILKSKNIPYKLGYYENYEGDYYIGRFAHAIPDKELHSEYFDELYEYYGENMWPNKKAYYYYDDKVRQYELLEKYGIQVPSVICNDLDELLKNVTLGTVIKSTYGAGSESTFYVWAKEHLDNMEEYISQCYNSENFFPCQVQEYIDVEYEYQIFISDNELYGMKQKQNKSFDNPVSFPHSKNFYNEHWVSRGEKPEIEDVEKDDLDIEFLQKLINIKKQLNTPNIKFDIIDNKVLEFSYMYGATFPITNKVKHNYYDLIEKKWKEKPISINEWVYKQQISVLKHFGIINGS